MAIASVMDPPKVHDWDSARACVFLSVLVLCPISLYKPLCILLLFQRGFYTCTHVGYFMATLRLAS